jgi:hypothetical protein
MSNGHSEGAMDRRDFFKTVIGGAAALSLSGAFPGVPKVVRQARAAEPEGQPGNFDGCRLVVFGSDSLRHDYARTLALDGAPALSYLNAINPIICSMNNGQSSTQPGWATIWTGLPSYSTRVFANREFEIIPRTMHIIKKLWAAYKDRDFYIVWITGKGPNISGKKTLLYKGTPDEQYVKGPHWEVRRTIVTVGHQGVYHGNRQRTNQEVFELAQAALDEATQHNNFCCFIHFQDPDHTGHVTKDYDSYMQKALEVDGYIYDLMTSLPQDTDIVYCSDHGFDFAARGDIGDGHLWSPCGMLATNFPTNNYPVVDMCSVGRLIYQLGGGNPDNTIYRRWDPDKRRRCRMYGLDLV